MIEFKCPTIREVGMIVVGTAVAFVVIAALLEAVRFVWGMS